MSQRKRKLPLDRFSTIARAAPVPPRPEFYSERFRTFEQRAPDAPLTQTEERRDTVPASPTKRAWPRSPHPSQTGSSSASAGVSGIGWEGGNDNTLPFDSEDDGVDGSGIDDSEEEDEGEDTDGDVEEGEEKQPRAQRESVRTVSVNPSHFC